MYIKCCYAESGWLSTHILPVEHTGNLISADLSKVLHQIKHSTCIPFLTIFFACAFIHKFGTELCIIVCKCLIYFCPLVHGHYSK